jgi:hypothetical protein
LALLLDAFEHASSAGWILSGALEGWGDPLILLFGLVVFLSAPTELRMKRLQARELERYGAEALLPEGSMHETHVNFLNWTAGYDEGIHDGRSRPRHEAWLSHLPCTVLRLEGSSTVDCLVQQVLTALG